MEKVVIAGSGCAGLTAAIYTARAQLSPLVLEGAQPGGQLTTTTDVENFPGFPDGINGPDLIMNMHAQAEKFGARFRYGTLEEFAPGRQHHRLKIDGEWVVTETLVVASGAAAKWPGLENEKELVGRGLTSCATCDGAFYRDVPVCVIGGGDSACEEATFLTRFASQVYLIHRRDTLRASKIMADRALSNPKVKILWNRKPAAYLTDDDGHVRGIVLEDTKNATREELAVKCVFVAIGHSPNTAPFRGKLDMDENGYLIQHDGTKTNVPGVFAAGDVADHVYRQAVTASGQGCAAALQAERYLAARE